MDVPDAWPSCCVTCGREVAAIQTVKNISRKSAFGRKCEWGHCGNAMCKEVAQDSVDVLQMMQNAEALAHEIREHAGLPRREASRNDFGYAALHHMAHLGALCREILHEAQQDWHAGDVRPPLCNMGYNGPLGRRMTHPDTWPEIDV